MPSAPREPARAETMVPRNSRPAVDPYTLLLGDGRDDSSKMTLRPGVIVDNSTWDCCILDSKRSEQGQKLGFGPKLMIFCECEERPCTERGLPAGDVRYLRTAANSTAEPAGYVK
jgi:hypothetical protein